MSDDPIEPPIGTPPAMSAAPVSTPPSPVRAAPMLMGITFISIAIIALALDPEGFDEQAILLWPVAVVLLTAGSTLALIAHVATRRR
jgi:hypothetical protein